MGDIFIFPYHEVDKGERVVLYGAGMVAEDYIKQNRKLRYCDIAFIVSKDFRTNVRAKRLDIDIFSPDTLIKRDDYDTVVVAVDHPKYKEEITEELTKLNLSEKKIVLTTQNIQAREKTWSQHGEDMLIYLAFCHMGYFKDNCLPSYIDVGAHHPFDLSNTALFYQMGCRGINIEANPELIKLFYKERPDDINLCFGIAGEEGKLPFYMTDLEGLNSFKEENIRYNEALVEKDTGVREKYEIRDIKMMQVKRLPDVIDEYCDGIWPDFMSIDIEGMEYESLEICDLKNGPALIAIEVNFDGDLFVDMMGKKGYFPYLWFRENILFVKNEYKPLVHAHGERAKK